MYRIIKKLWYVGCDWVAIFLYHGMVWFNSMPERWKSGSKGNVVYISGWNEYWIWGWKLLDELNNRGYRIWLCDELEKKHGFEKISVSAEILNKFLEEENLKNVIVIGHSKGGLIGQYLVDHLDTQNRVKKMFAIASPFGGTMWAFLPMLSLNEMAEGGTLAKEFQLEEERSRSVNIYSEFDPSVLPKNCLKLSGAKNVELPVIGHARVMATRELITEVVRNLS